MPNRAYEKGRRFEWKIRDLLSSLGSVQRSAGSKGVDLRLTKNLRIWNVSCKTKKSSICKLIDRELETHDCFIWGYDRGIPIIAMLLPKFIEIAGDGE